MGAMIGRLLGRFIGIRGGIPCPEGPYKDIGVLRLRPSEQTPFVQVFYPADKARALGAKKSKESLPYMRKSAGYGLANWLGSSRLGFILSSSLAALSHPFLHGAPIHDEFSPQEGSKKLPVILFSHGLGGTAELYSKVCSDLASYGYVVIAMEHEDGSGSYAESAQGNQPIYYRRPPEGMKYERESVIAFRKPFLEHRAAEVRSLVTFIHSKAVKSEPAESPELSLEQVTIQTAGSEHAATAVDIEGAKEVMLSLDDLLQHIDVDQMFLGGHSFGGATTVHCSHDQFIGRNLRGTFILDLWPFPIAQEHLDKGMPMESLSILTEQFAKNDEAALSRDLVRNSQGKLHSFYIPGTTHQQYSDTPWFLSERLGKKVLAFGDTPKEASQQTLVSAIVHFLQGQRSFEDPSLASSDAKLLPFHHSE